MKFEEVLARLRDDEVVQLSSVDERNELFDYMIDNDIDPEDYRAAGLEIWIA